MKNITLSGTLDSVFLRESDKRIYLAVEVFDDILDMPQHMTVNITNELEEIYKGVEFDKEFVRRIEKKLKLTVGSQLIRINHIGQIDWELSVDLKELYSPVLLTPDKVKFGDPLLVSATITGFKRLRDGQDFPLSGLIAQCSVGVKPAVTEKLHLDVIENKSYSDMSTLQMAFVDVDYEFDLINTELRAHKCCRDNFTDTNGKLVKKHEVYSRIANLLLGKTITLEYDEHFGYSIWDPLIYSIDENYK